MSFADEILRRIEDAWERFVAEGIPGAAVIGQLAGTVLPPPAADADVPYAATEHTHPLTDLEQDGATVGQVPTWNGTAWAADDPAGGSLPLTTQGDLLTRDATTNVRLAIGAGGTYLRSDGSDPSWQAIGAADLPLVDLGDNDFLFGALPVVNGGTGATTATAAMANLSTTGTFTPTLVGDTTPGTFTYTAANTGGRYTRFGNRVYVNGQIQITAVSVAPSGTMNIAGLPFTAANVGSVNVAGESTLSAWQGITLPANYTQVTGLVFSAESRIRLMRNGSGQSVGRVQGSEFGLVGGSIILRFNASYEV